MRYTVAILKNETAFDHKPWVKSCDNNTLIESYDVIDCTVSNWLSLVCKKRYDLVLLRPPGRLEIYKRLYDERVYIIAGVLGKRVYPSMDEVFVYENKRFLRDWLNANEIPHPDTFVFYDLRDTLDFLNTQTDYPIVAKTNIGASGNGVVILKKKEDSIRYAKNAFSKGIKTKSGPKLLKGSVIEKFKKAILHKGFFRQRLNDYSASYGQRQKGFIILQRFVPHAYEWRCVRIGDSFFAHKKIAVNNMSSGHLIKSYDAVPISLLDFIRKITEKTKLSSVAIDCFETDKEYLVNEIQCFFGESDPYQMLVDGKPGRYRFISNEWIFEEGMFNTNLSYDLRLEHALSMIERSGR